MISLDTKSSQIIRTINFRASSKVQRKTNTHGSHRICMDTNPELVNQMSDYRQRKLFFSLSCCEKINVAYFILLMCPVQNKNHVHALALTVVQTHLQFN